MIERLRHAFAIDPPGAASPNERQRELVDRLCRLIVRRRMTMPALALLEMSRPLNYLTAQAMHFLAPMASVLFRADDFEQLAAFLEQRGSVDYLCQRLEALDRHRADGQPANHEAEEST